MTDERDPTPATPAARGTISALSARDHDWLVEVVPQLGEIQVTASALALYGAASAFAWAHRAFWACDGRGEIALAVVAAASGIWLAGSIGRDLARDRKQPTPHRSLTASERAALMVAACLAPDGAAAKAARLLRDGAVGHVCLHEAIWKATTREAIWSPDPVEAIHRREPNYPLVYGAVLIGWTTGVWAMGMPTCR